PKVRATRRRKERCSLSTRQDATPRITVLSGKRRRWIYMRSVVFRNAARVIARLWKTSRPRRNGILLGQLGLFIILLTGLCGTLFAAEPQGVVLVGAGSSVPLPLYRKWAELYNQTNKNVQLQYLAMGNVEGIAQITHGVSDFGAGEVPLSAEERRAGNL